MTAYEEVDEYNVNTKRIRKTRIRSLYILFIALVVVVTFIIRQPLAAQQNLSLTGQIGYGYHRSNPFLQTDESLHYHQLFVSLDLRGFLWTPRFMTFSVSGNYADTNYNQELEDSNFSNFGYQLQADFFPQKKINFGLRYGRSELNFDQIIQNSTASNTHVINKDFYFNILSIKFLPSIRINYLDQKYLSEFNQADNQSEKRVEVSANKTLGKSYFDMNYRSINRENQYLAFDSFHQNLRITERIDFSPDTKLYLNGIYSDYSVKLPDNSTLGSSSGSFSIAFNKKIGEKILGNVRYNFNLRAGEGYEAYSHNVGIRVNYNLSQSIVLSPDINYFTENLFLDSGEEHITEPGVGLNLSLQKEIFKIRMTSTVGAYYRNYKSDVKGDINDLSQFFSLSFNVGEIDKIIGSLSYTYNKIDLDTSQAETLEAPFYDGIGRKHNNHQVRLELRSNALYFVNIYLYSHYNKYRWEYLLDGISDAQNFDNGITLDFRQFSLSANHGISRFYHREARADYNSYSFILDVRLIKGLDFRAQNIKRTRTDITFLGDYELIQEAYLKYNIGKFLLSAIYRRRTGQIQGFDRRDEGISFRLSRSLGIIF